MSQFHKLRALVAALIPHNRFYTKRLRAADLSERTLTSLEDFSDRLGFTSKHELMADQVENPPYGSNLTFELKRYSRFCQTSGTTGQPLVWLDTAESWDWLLGNWGCVYRAADVLPGDRIFFAFSFGPFLGFWTAYEAAAKLGFLCIPGGGLSSAGRLQLLIQHQAEVLLCTPTYALHLAESAQAAGIDLKRAAIRKIIVAGEPGGSIPDVRQRISKAWNGARVFDHYGMTEVGPVTFEDFKYPGHQRVMEESYYAEIINPLDGTPMPPNQIGELVLTTLGRVGTPLLRYRTGDLVKRNPSLPGFSLEGGILGRVDDMIVVRGVNLYPAAIDAVVRSIPLISEYRVEVSQRGAMCEVQLEIESEDENAIADLNRALDRAFALRIPVRRVPSLPRFELKARRWVKR
ncbi:MAG: phenylacetate--CoA ligase family protein [Chthoniobacteraceae bacterium]|nr:phenylacetate--CoA ligase family protein [Chthoniobacteraceae bacterium]